MRTHRKLSMHAGAITLVLVGLGTLVPGALHAQDEDLAPLPRPISLIVGEHPSITISLDGDSGPLQITGTLEKVPAGTLHLQDITGKPLLADWSEVRTLSRVEFPSEGMPVGAYRVTLVTDPMPHDQIQNPEYAAFGSGSFDPGTPAWRLLKMPGGTVTLKGEPYGTLSLPLSRVKNWQMSPIRGTLGALPAGDIHLEPFAGTTVSLPLPTVQWFQRDLKRGTITVAVSTPNGPEGSSVEQTFSGKLIDVPRVSIVLGEPGHQTTVPVSEVVVLERSLPGGQGL